MAKRISRKKQLIQIASKRGWEDGLNGADPRPPQKSVMKPFAHGFTNNDVPWEEEQAYWSAYEEGKDSIPGEINPYRG